MGALLAVVAAVALLPPVRTRIADLGKEFDENEGGRMHLWNHVAPALIAKYPGGVGFRSLTELDLRRVSQRLMKLHRYRKWRGISHMHSNLIQILVTGGWLGLLLYLLWMGEGAANGVSMARRTFYPLRDRALGLCPLAMLAAILLNGAAEYNFADAEILIVLAVLLGICGRLAHELKRHPHEAWSAPSSPSAPQASS